MHTGLSARWLLLLWDTDFRAYRLQDLQLVGSRAQASAVVVHGLSCPVTCGVFPDQGTNPFFTTGPPGTSIKNFKNYIFL